MFEQLFISTGIACNATYPTILQSLAYFMSLADGATFKSPPPSPLRMSPRTSRATSARNSPTTSRFGSVSQPSTPQNEEDYSSEQQFALDDFSIKSVMGVGRTKVYYEAKNQIALKAIDLYKQSEMLDELKREVEVYNQLSDLQGISIPTLVLHGYWEGGMYCIGLSLCGKIPEELDDVQKQTLLKTLASIHSKGILHNDIKRENILVDDCGNPYLIDFGFATYDESLDAQRADRNMLLECMQSL